MSKLVSTTPASRLRYVSDSALSIRRVRRGGGFVYLEADDRVIRSGSILQRIKSLVIPPAWTNVRICAGANGHIQAVGRDARHRKQYVYHPAWRAIRDRRKYEHLLEFAQALPRIRKTVQRDLGERGSTKNKALAAVVRLLDLSRIRVGNEEYARTNQSYGLTTLRNRHVHVRGEKLRFQFRGKSGQEHSVAVSDPALARVVTRCQAIPGQELFQYFDETGQRRRIKSRDVNHYLREISRGDFTAKDFRTWAGTVLMAGALRDRRNASSELQRRRNVQKAIQTVAAHLGNTPAICRRSYIHPSVIDTYQSRGGQWRATLNGAEGPARTSSTLRALEAAVVRLLQSRPFPGGHSR